MELWRRCFEDTDEFIRFYFERKYSDANSLIYEENGKARQPCKCFLIPCVGKMSRSIHLISREHVPYPMSATGAL